MDTSISSSINTVDRSSYVNNESTPLQNVRKKDEGFKYICGTFGVVAIILSAALGVAIYRGPGEVPFGSGIASDQSICSEAGNEIFMRGGNAIDVATAVTVCLGVILPHLTGIGGNGLILVYNHKTEKVLTCVDSWPPQGIITLPQLMLALYSVHSTYGQKKWSIVLEPAVRIARNGFPLPGSLLNSLKHLSPNANDGLKSWLQSLKPGENIRMPQLAATLEVIQEQGVNALYEGHLREEFQTYLDLKSISEPVLNKGSCSEVTTEDYHLISSGTGSAGHLLLDILASPNFNRKATVQELADLLLGKELLSWPLPSGVVVSVVDKDENYVSIVSGLGPVLGSQNLLKGGYILGSLLHQSNQSLINSFGAPLIATKLFNKCLSRIITGGVDVRDLLQVVPKLLWAPMDINATVEAPRVRITEHGLFAETNHVPSLPFNLPPASMPYPVINVIQKNGDNTKAYKDSRSL